MADRIEALPSPDGAPLDTTTVNPSALRFESLASDRGPVADQVALVMPTSLRLSRPRSCV